MYVYAMRMAQHEQFGIVCLGAVADYESGRIKKHEQTMPKKVEDRTRLADIQGANAGPLFFSYPEEPTVSDIVNSAASGKAHFDYEDPESQVRHRVGRTESRCGR